MSENEKKPKRKVALKILNPFLLLSLLVQITSIIIFAFIAPVVDIGETEYYAHIVHNFNGFILIIIIILHIGFNYNWIKNNYFSKSS